MFYFYFTGSLDLPAFQFDQIIRSRYNQWIILVCWLVVYRNWQKCIVTQTYFYFRNIKITSQQTITWKHSIHERKVHTIAFNMLYCMTIYVLQKLKYSKYKKRCIDTGKWTVQTRIHWDASTIQLNKWDIKVIRQPF